ncbi:hypothetical protein [Silvibacterium acidisoli]|uniref:hypothetical protein n=1 Tax=Acidobacteriaceae bacterium ZG23-2 TaxID=2883246 RepID=UPI00406C65D9
MLKAKAGQGRSSINRREFIAGGLTTMVASWSIPFAQASDTHKARSLRAVNIMNFIRAEEPREPMDLMKPVREQMALIKARKFPATWLLQYDALVEGPYVEFLKAEMPANHEVGIWFEMNRKICDDAGIAWRGNPQWEWDYHVPIAYSIGYSPEDRKKLADTAMATFKRIFGHSAKTVASWNMDAISAAHLSDQYEIDAFGNCRDQLATDGFTIWGSPIAAYYPNRINAWSPALERKNQIETPMFRLLGQDPVYYYDNVFRYPDTMEPVWPSGQSETFVDRFFDMMAHAPTQSIAYAQLGQENSFGWPMMSKAYAMQMEKLSILRDGGKVVVETMGETGRNFKRSFSSTPAQAQVMLEDPFGKDDPPQRTVWYQSKYLRANLHFRGNEFYLRDLHIYDDRFPQPYLTDPVKKHGIEQRMLAVLDGYHWSDDIREGHDGIRAMGRFVAIGLDGKEIPLTMAGLPTVSETQSSLQVTVPLAEGGTLSVLFAEKWLNFKLVDVRSPGRLVLKFEWVPDKSALQQVSRDRLQFRFRDFDYSIGVAVGAASMFQSGVSVSSAEGNMIRLQTIS